MASILDVRGIGPALAKLLAACDIKTAEDLAAAKLADLLALPGIGQPRAMSLMAAAKALAGAAPNVSSEASNKSEIKSKKKSKKALRNPENPKRRRIKRKPKMQRPLQAGPKNPRKRRKSDPAFLILRDLLDIAPLIDQASAEWLVLKHTKTGSVH